MVRCRSSKESSKAEVTAAEARGRAEAEKAGLEKALESAMANSQAEQSALQMTIQRLEADAKDYKACCLGSSIPFIAHAGQPGCLSDTAF